MYLIIEMFTLDIYWLEYWLIIFFIWIDPYTLSTLILFTPKYQFKYYTLDKLYNFM